VDTLTANTIQQIAADTGCYTVIKDKAGAPVTLFAIYRPPVYKAYHGALRCHAALRIIPPEAFATEAAREQAFAVLRNASRFRHRNVTTVFPPERAGEAFLYGTEFCQGETLTGRLLRDGPFPPQEALNIARQTASGLKAAGAFGLPFPALSPDGIILTHEDGRTAPKILGLGFPAGVASGAGEDSGIHCEFRAPELVAGAVVDEAAAVYSLGALLCCMGIGIEQFAALRGKSPVDLRAALEGAWRVEPGVVDLPGKVFPGDSGLRPRTIGEFEELIDSALPARTPPGFRGTAPLPPPAMGTIAESGGLSIPAALLEKVQPGTVMALQPVSPMGGGGINVCAEPCFRMGRSAMAHLETRFYPRTKANDDRTRQLSKVHVTARRENEKVVLFDGDGLRPSANGSKFNHQQLSPATPVPLIGSGELCLADEYSVRVTPILLTGADAPVIRNLADWRGPATGCSSGGAVIFAPANAGEGTVAVWLFSSVPFGTGRARPFDFELSADQEAAGVLRHWRGCFWIERRSQPFSIDGVEIGPAQIVPLASGQFIAISGARYQVTIGPS
jgi:serine/threonine protein kinase